MEHWVKTTKSRIKSIISKIKRQKLQNSKIGRLIKVAIKKLIILAVVLYKFAVTKIINSVVRFRSFLIFINKCSYG